MNVYTRDDYKIRDGWYKMGGRVTASCLVTGAMIDIEQDIPKHRIIHIKNNRWNNFFMFPVSILHEYFEYGEIVYTRFMGKWEKGTYRHYEYDEEIERNHMIVGSDGYNDCSDNCISEAEYKEKNPVSVTPPSIEIDIKINGQTANLCDISEETWNNLRSTK
jgi:hypothetical protein